MDAFDLATSQPWAITESKFRTMLAIAQRAHDPEAVTNLDALQTRESRPLQGSRRAEVRGDVAIVPVVGTIFRRANLFTEISGATSVEFLARDIQAAIDNPEVTALVLDIDSPGGQVAGISELADLIFSARERMTVIAYGGGIIASGAYWLASQADEIVIDQTATLGSIGVLMTQVDSREADEKRGFRTYRIVSSNAPDKQTSAETDEGRAKLQKIVDDLESVFVGAVARGRGVTADTVRQDFGRGGVMVGQTAIDAGLADRFASLEGTLATLAANRFNRRVSHMTLKTGTGKGPIAVATTAALRAAFLAGHLPEEITITEIDTAAIKAQGVEEGRVAAEAVAKPQIEAARKEGAENERKRIKSLRDITIKGFEADITAAIDSGADAATTALAINKKIQERGGDIATIAAAAPGAVAAGGAAKNPDGGKPKRSWDKIAAKFGAKATA